jgi:hypothetical protein
MIGKIISVLGEPGVAEGLLNYQKDVDKQREKVRERIEARMLAIQKLMISRGVSSAKAKTYSADVATVVNRLRIKQGENAGQFAEGTEIILQALRNDPSSAKVLKSMIDKGDKAMNYPLSASQIVEFFPVLQTTGGGTPSGYMSDEAIQKVINSGGLEDFDTFLQVMRGASTPASTSGTSVFESPFFPETKTEKINLQGKTFNDTLLQIANRQLNLYDEGSRERTEINTALGKAAEQDFSTLRDMFAVEAVDEIDTTIPLYTDIFKNNPILKDYYNTNITVKSVPQVIKNVLINDPSKEKRALFDKKYGIGASGYVLRRGV